jgi:hypothetical protein
MNRLYLSIRIISDEIGLDVWDIDVSAARQYMAQHEAEPVSRHWFGSPCRFVRSIDAVIHVYLPDALIERYPMMACYLRSTSPRWGRAWREW